MAITGEMLIGARAVRGQGKEIRDRITRLDENRLGQRLDPERMRLGWIVRRASDPNDPGKVRDQLSARHIR